ncbi:MAG: dodecin family protein [Myxococcota bacterium]
MAVAKVIEITAEHPESFEAAIKQGIARAGNTVDNIQSAWINEQTCVVKDNQVASYRVNMRVTFLLGK